ncbi:unnamed protein product [Rotaria sp. Silwood1]|nr:unnamed protein product [Rotaria sp. Silwood1]
MIIDDEAALRDWLVTTLEPLCDAEPIALARYVLALIAKDKPLDKLRENCIDRLEVFLDRATKDFVDQLFDVIRNRRYIPEGKKENVQPKPSETNTETSGIQQQQQNVALPTKQEDIQQTEITPISTTSSSTAINQPIKRRYSSRSHSNNNNESHKRQSTDSPLAKRTQRSYSHSSTDSSPPSSPKNPNFLSNKIPCKDFFDNKGYCALGDSCPYDHGSNVLSFEQQNYYPSYQQYDISSTNPHQQYNPEIPDLKYDLRQTSSMLNRQPLPIGQRTLVTVVTNAEPLTSEQRLRPNNSNGPMHRTKRHVTTAPYPMDRRTQQYDQQSNKNHQDTNQNRARKRPWSKPDGSGSTSTTLEIRKIPAEFNTISKLNEHFSKFGTVTNVQIAFDGSSDSALVAYATFKEAETAYKNPEPLFNNRFIKIFWHNSNKGQNPSNTTNPNPTSSDATSIKKQRTTPNSTKHHWTKIQKSSSNKNEIPPKKKSTIPPVPSVIKKEAAKKAAIEIRRKKQGLLEEQIQQQKLLLKKLETAETNEDKESIRSLMKQVDSTIVTLKDSIRTIPIKSSLSTTKISQQDLLKKRAETLKKQIESLRAKTSADMRRAISNTIENEISNSNRTHNIDEDDEVNLLNEEDQLLTDNEKTKDQSDEKTTYICDRKSSCGCSSDLAVLARIFGGEAVSRNSWGWIVGLYRSNNYYCAGSLISSTLILTAAHCITSELSKLEKITVIAGSNRLSNRDGQGQIRRVYEVFIHPDFDKNSKVNDIGIIRLSTPFDMTNSKLTIVCLPHAVTAESIAEVEYPVPGTTLVVIGWGATEYSPMNPSTTLQQVTVKAVASTSSDCTTSTNEMVNVTVHFCAGISGGGKDACLGDSGGPIMAFVDNRWQIMGITSIGYGCALPGHSGIYTRVAYYIPFIEKIKDQNQTIYASIIASITNGYNRMQTTMIENIIFIILLLIINMFHIL